jgi:hypothetical protein
MCKSKVETLLLCVLKLQLQFNDTDSTDTFYTFSPGNPS